MPTSSDRNKRVQVILAEIEAEMKHLGYWSEKNLPEEAFHFQQAFAMDTMTFAQWLQFVFIPRVIAILDEQGDFPERSMVGTQAIREFDGNVKAASLVRLLNDFDRLIIEV